MSKQPSKALIGMFVIGAVTLVVIALIAFGKGAFFSQKIKGVMYFEGSVKGLQIGSPLMFRGVPVGQVTDIRLLFHSAELAFIIPVYVEIDPEKLTIPEGKESLPGGGKLVEPLVKKGLRAQLQMQSFVTGQLVINLDFYPDKPVRLTGFDKRLPELPTIPGDFDQLQKSIASVDVGAIAAKLERVLDSVDALVASKDLKGSIAALEKTLVNIDKLSRNADAQIDPLVKEIRGTLATANKTLDGVDKTALEYKDLASQNRNIGYDIHKTLVEVQALSRSLRSLVDYLDRHPEALIRGKSTPKGESK